MKYENFARCGELVKKLDTYNYVLKNLDDGFMVKVCQDSSLNRIIIQVDSRFENEYLELSNQYIDKIKMHVCQKMAAIRKELDGL